MEICHLRVGLVPSLRARETPSDKTGDELTRTMKRARNLYEQMISDDNIEKAIDEVNASHRWRGEHQGNETVAWIELTKPERVKELRLIIETGFEQTKPTVKRRYDRNAKKWRDISEPKLWPDQYIHHILIQTLEPVMMRGMDRFCCGSIKNRGTLYGIKAIKKWMKCDRKGTRWCGEFDIYHFYDQLKPEVVVNRFKHLVKDHKVIDLIERVLVHGVLIGAYTSQWFANTVLQPLDVLIRRCGASHYVRYMDNFTIFSSNKKTIIKTMKEMVKWLEPLGLRLKDNWQYFKTRKRLPNALGYRFGHTYTLIRKHRLLDIKRQIRTYFKRKGEVSHRFASSLISRIGGLKHCNSRNILKRLVPKGLLKKLKNIVRKHQREELEEWSTFLERRRITMKMC